MRAKHEAEPDGRRRLILRAGMRAVGRSMLLSLVAVGPGLLLLSLVPVLGMVWVLTASFTIMAWTYRRPWRMTWIACLIPPLAASLGYLAQWSVLDSRLNPALFGVAILAGLGLGIVRGWAHEVYAEGQAIYARRLRGTLVAWLIAYLATQLFGAWRQQGLTEAGHAAGGFTTAMWVAVSGILLVKFRLRRRNMKQARIVAAVLLLLGSAAPSARAELTAAALLDRLVQAADIGISADSMEIRTSAATEVHARRDFLYTWSNRHGQAKPRTATVIVSVRRFPSSGDAQNDAARLRALLGRGSNQDTRNPTQAIQHYTHVRDLSYGQSSFAWRMVTVDQTLHQTGPTCAGVVYAGPWVVVINVDNVRPSLGMLGHAMTPEEREAHLLRLLHTVQGRLPAEVAPPPPPASPYLPAVTDYDGPPPRQGHMDDLVVASLVVSAILVAAGLAVNTANAIAAALAEAGQTTSSSAVRPPPLPRQLPPLIDPFHDQPMVRNDAGQYWDPAGSRWVDRGEAEVIQAELQAEWAARNRERAAALREQQRQADRDWADAQRRVREEAVTEAQARIAIAPMRAPALDMQDEDTVRESLNEAWARHERSQAPALPIGDYSSAPAGVVSAVDEFNRQKARLGGLDKLQATAMDDLRRVRDAQLEAEARGIQPEIDYLAGQRQIAMDNFRRINEARVNASERMARAGDRILVRGAGVVCEVGTRAGLDWSMSTGMISSTGRAGSNFLDQRRRGNLPWQRTSVRMDDPGLELHRASLGQGQMLAARPRTPLGTGGYAEAYRGLGVVRNDAARGLGGSDARTPHEFRISPKKIHAAAVRKGASPEAFETLTKHHESIHQLGGFHRDQSLYAGNPGASMPRSPLARRQELAGVHDLIRTEQAVHQHLRADFHAGRIPGVSMRDMACYDAHHRQVLMHHEVRRAALRSLLRLP